MRIMKWNRGLRMFGVAAVGVVALAGLASAQDYRNVSTDRAGSMVVFPKVISNQERDTIIRLTNTGNPLVYVHCFYIEDDCSETDFDLVLTRQQPTHWSAGNGRGSRWRAAGWGTDETGLPPGLIPPVPVGFQGELICIQVDSDGMPWPGNALKGDAVLRSKNGDVSSYNATSFRAADANGDTLLELNLTPTSGGGEYTACPDTLTLNHFTDGYVDLVADQAGGSCTNTNCSISTELTMVPCSIDMENQSSPSVTLTYNSYDEFEIPSSGTVKVGCWTNKTLGSIDSVAFRNRATFGLYTRFTPIDRNGGVIAVAEEIRKYGATATARAAFNVHGEGSRTADEATNGDCPVRSGASCARIGKTDTVTIPSP